MSQHKATAMRKIDAPHYSYGQALYHSFFNDKLYIDIGKRWRGFSFGYLLLLMCLVALPISLRLILDFNHFYNQQVLLPLKKLPEFMVQNGQVSFDKPMPYLVKNDLGDVVSMIDTTGTITDIDNRNPHLAILITKDSFIYRSPNPPQLFSNTTAPNISVNKQVFPKEMNQVFDGDAWIESSGIKNFQLLAEIIIYPTVAAFFFMIYLVLLFALSLMAQLVASLLLKFTLTYGQTFRLLTVSSTPQIVALMIAMTLNWFFKGMGFVLIILLAVYFSFAVLALKRASKKLVFA